MKLNFAFKLETPTDRGIIYPLSFINPLDEFIKSSGLIFMYNDTSDFNSYTTRDFIGLAQSYSLNKDIVTVNFQIMNDRFASLSNIGTLLALPLTRGSIGEDKVLNVKEVQAIVVML